MYHGNNPNYRITVSYTIFDQNLRASVPHILRAQLWWDLWEIRDYCGGFYCSRSSTALL